MDWRECIREGVEIKGVLRYSGSMPRLFIAIPLPPPVTDLIGSIRAPLPGARWGDSRQAHLTLHFLGDHPESGVEPVGELLRQCTQIPPFHLTTGRLGTFGPPDTPRVLWLGVSDAGERLCRVHALLADGLRGMGLTPEDRPFRPHLTVARLRGVTKRELMQVLGRTLPQVTFPVERIVLYESILSPSGAIHRERASARLTGGTS